MTGRIGALVRRTGCQRGGALVELAIALPLLLIIFFATADFSRAFYMSLELNNAARAGAQYCSTSISNSVNTSGTLAVANAAAPNVAGQYSSSASGAVCYCATEGGAFTVASCTSTCSSGQHLAVTCTVTTTGVFSRATPYPGLPATLTITRAATMRVSD